MAKRGSLTGRGREMRRLVTAQERSGLSLAEFARRRGVPVSTLTWWRRRLGDRDRDKALATEKRFVEVTPTRMQSQTAAFEIVLGDGTMVRVAGYFAEEDLRRLLAVLRC